MKNLVRFLTGLNLEYFTNSSISLSGELIYHREWRPIATLLRVQAGKTWGDLLRGHNSFRIGGASGEGLFTQRTPRLFPVRGFKHNILDADQALAGAFELQVPLANLQAGYKTLPLFFQDIALVTFVDAGMAAEVFSADELLLSAGLELITGLELAWIFNLEFRMGLAWPLIQPEDLNQEGPIFLFQVGVPL